MAFRHQDMGRAFHGHILLFSVMAGWIAELFFMVFFAYIAAVSGQNIAEYKVHWLMVFQ